MLRPLPTCGSLPGGGGAAPTARSSTSYTGSGGEDRPDAALASRNSQASTSRARPPSSNGHVGPVRLETCEAAYRKKLPAGFVGETAQAIYRAHPLPRVESRAAAIVRGLVRVTRAEVQRLVGARLRAFELCPKLAKRMRRRRFETIKMGGRRRISTYGSRHRQSCFEMQAEAIGSGVSNAKREIVVGAGYGRLGTGLRRLDGVIRDARPRASALREGSSSGRSDPPYGLRRRSKVGRNLSLGSGQHPLPRAERGAVFSQDRSAAEYAPDKPATRRANSTVK